MRPGFLWRSSLSGESVSARLSARVLPFSVWRWGTEQVPEGTLWGVIEGDRFWVVSSPVFLRNPLAPILDCRFEMTEHRVLLHAQLGYLRIARPAIAAWAGIWLFEAIIAEVAGAWGKWEPFGQLVPSSYVHMARPLLLSVAVSALMALLAALVSRLQRPRLVSQVKDVLSIVSEHETR